ncbi:MAG: N-acyl homoserine lactonase family protein [Myxococcota bacterium]|nr:N-acyl homoserine lactonase family protein [Myxococcota bacterium]
MRYLKVSLIFLVAAFLSICCNSKSGLRPDKGWRVFALDYGRSTMRESTVVAGGSKDKQVSFAWMAWLAVGRKKTVLIDTGFALEDVAKKWGLRRFEPVPKLLGATGIQPRDITDIVLTHLHWDHCGNLSPYTRATVYVQRQELDFARKLTKKAKAKGGYRRSDLSTIDKLAKKNRLKILNGDQQMLPGIKGYIGGRHTAGIQWIEISTESAVGSVILASDNAYVHENIKTLRSTGSTGSPTSDVLQFKKMLSLVKQDKFVIPGHAPSVTAFPRVADNVYEIR